MGVCGNGAFGKPCDRGGVCAVRWVLCARFRDEPDRHTTSSGSEASDDELLASPQASPVSSVGSHGATPVRRASLQGRAAPAGEGPRAV